MTIKVSQHCPAKPFILVGTKTDLRRDQNTIQKVKNTNNREPIAETEGEILAEELKAVKYLECSAVTKEGLDELIIETVKAVINAKIEKPTKNLLSFCVIL